MTSYALTPLQRGFVLVSAAAVAWGAGGAVADELFRLSGLGPIAVSFWRFAIAALIMAGQRLRQGFPATPPASHWRTSALTGVALAVYQTAYFGAVANAGLALGTLITLGASPILVGVGARVVLGEHLSKRGVLAIGIAVAGLLLLIAHPAAGRHTALGMTLAFLSAIGYSAVTLWARRTGNMAAGAATWGAGALCLLPFAMVQGAWPRTDHIVQAAAWLLFLGIVPTLLAYHWYFAGLVVVPGATAAVLVLLEPATAAVLAVLLGEQITASLVLGSILLLTAIAALGREQS